MTKTTMTAANTTTTEKENATMTTTQKITTNASSIPAIEIVTAIGSGALFGLTRDEFVHALAERAPNGQKLLKSAFPTTVGTNDTHWDAYRKHLDALYKALCGVATVSMSRSILGDDSNTTYTAARNAAHKDAYKALAPFGLPKATAADVDSLVVFLGAKNLTADADKCRKAAEAKAWESYMTAVSAIETKKADLLRAKKQRDLSAIAQIKDELTTLTETAETEHKKAMKDYAKNYTLGLKTFEQFRWYMESYIYHKLTETMPEMRPVTLEDEDKNRKDAKETREARAARIAEIQKEAGTVNFEAEMEAEEAEEAEETAANVAD